MRASCVAQGVEGEVAVDRRLHPVGVDTRDTEGVPGHDLGLGARHLAEDLFAILVAHPVARQAEEGRAARQAGEHEEAVAGVVLQRVQPVHQRVVLGGGAEDPVALVVDLLPRLEAGQVAVPVVAVKALVVEALIGVWRGMSANRLDGCGHLMALGHF
jgi:hypothetical protein